MAQTASSQLTYNELMVQYDSAWTFKNLQLIPVRFKRPNGQPAAGKVNLPLVTFAEALQKNKIKLQEMQYEKGADVNWLQVTNHSKQTVLVQSGEIVSGGKQDRMVGETKFIAPGKTDFIHVYCIEKRRWDDKPKEFAAQGIANSELRKIMDVSGRQHEVWKEIDKQYTTNKKTSETFSYLQLYKDSLRADTAYIHYFMQKCQATDSAFAGFIFITADRIMSCELFASPELTSTLFSNLLASYIHSAITHGSAPNISYNKTKLFIDKVISDEASQKTYVSAHGKIHLQEGKIIHLVAYD